jgi:hypothetical protein
MDNTFDHDDLRTDFPRFWNTLDEASKTALADHVFDHDDYWEPDEPTAPQDTPEPQPQATEAPQATEPGETLRDFIDRATAAQEPAAEAQAVMMARLAMAPQPEVSSNAWATSDAGEPSPSGVRR